MYKWYNLKNHNMDLQIKLRIIWIRSKSISTNTNFPIPKLLRQMLHGKTKNKESNVKKFETQE